MRICPQCDTGYPDNAETCPTHGGLLSEILDLRPGMLIRKTYRIERLLGKGGMGSVYLARHELMDAQRALKFLSHELNNDEAFTRRFLREGRMLRQVRHKNVVDCGDLERAEDERLFFAMEFVDGPDLRGLMHQAGGRLDGPDALKIVRGMAEGLGAAHALGMVHRDIKPENVLMARDKSGWVPKIADFGIVATVESSTVYKTTRGSLLTPPYAAPEQWRGTRASELDGRTDLYALGGVLFEMLTGQTVFSAENYEGWLFEHLQTPPRPPSSLRPELASWKGLDALVLRLLAKDREERSRDVAELLGLLDAVRLTTPERQPTVPEIRRATVVEPEPVRPSTTPIPQLEIKPEPVVQAGQLTRLSPEQPPDANSEYVVNGTKQEPHWGLWLGLMAAPFLLVAILIWYFSNSYFSNSQDSSRTTKPTTQTASGTESQPASSTGTTGSQSSQDPIYSRRSVTLLPRVSGVLTKILVRSGDHVKAGQLLMEIDTRQQMASVASARATESEKKALYDYKAREVERQRKLFEAGVTSSDAFDQAQQSFSNTKADYESAVQLRKTQEEQLAYYIIRAPFDGVVGNIPVQVGEVVSSATVLTTVNENKDLETYSKPRH